jgi:hypothetical protein
MAQVQAALMAEGAVARFGGAPYRFCGAWTVRRMLRLKTNPVSRLMRWFFLISLGADALVMDGHTMES